MRWIRVKIHDLEKLVLLDMCPNCLAAGASVPVSIVRNLVVPGTLSVGLMQWKYQWKFCPACAKRFRHYERRKRWFVFVPAVLLAFFAAVVAAMNPRPAILPSPFGFLLTSLFVGLVGSFFLSLFQRFASKPEGALSNFPTVKLLRHGESFGGKRRWGIFYFAHPTYVRQLVMANDPETLTVNQRSL